MKILHIGDLHFGEHGNSEKYNQSLLDFVQWTIDTFHGKVDKVVQLGDYFHQRNHINVNTMNYGIAGAKMLNKAWGQENVYVLAGNHCLYYLERLDVSSLAAIEPYVTVIDEFTLLGDDILLAPWITDGDMWNELLELKGPKYCYGHFELNGFRMNDAYVMESGYSPATLNKMFDRVVTGHYHSQQEQGVITYTGTPIPITMNEANGKHGVFIHDTETDELTFYEYDKVKIISVPYDEIDELIEQGLDPESTTVRLEFPSDLEDETLIEEYSNKLKELNFERTKIKYKGKKAQEILSTEVEEIGDIDNIDGFVVTHIKNGVEVSGVDNALLETLYNQSIKRSKEILGE